MNIDPLAEKFFDASPYAYVLNSPVVSFDPDGMDRYIVDENGKMTLALKEKKGSPDMLFAYNSKTGDVVDTDKDGEIHTEDAVEVEGGLVGQLMNFREGSEVSGQKYYSSVAENSKGREKDYLKMFKFLADYTNIEYSLTSFESSGKSILELATYRETDNAPSTRNLGYGIDNSKVKWHVHNHPSGYASERSSMGERENGLTRYSDGWNAVKHEVNFPNHVYFPESKKLYNVTMYGIEYIQKVYNANQLKK